MRLPIVVAILAVPVLAQTGQEGPRREWPCVPGRAMDAAYLDLSESTGGQLVLLRKGEAAHSGVVMSASITHPATILRVVGNLNGTRELEFPVDSTVESILLLVSVQCRERVAAFRPSGAELTQRTASMLTELAAATMLRVDQPEPGRWKVRLTGSGLYVLSVLAKAGIALTTVHIPDDGGEVEFHLRGEVSGPAARLVDATGAPAPTRSQRYRVLVTGQDAAGWTVQRMWPNLFRPTP